MRYPLLEGDTKGFAAVFTMGALFMFIINLVSLSMMNILAANKLKQAT